jgi:hypothetical protein
VAIAVLRHESRANWIAVKLPPFGVSRCNAMWTRKPPVRSAAAAPARRPRNLGRLAAAVPLLAALAACSANTDHLGAAFVDPAKFTLYRCDDLNRRAQALVAREAELRNDMARAEQGAGGGIANAIAYRPLYLSVRGELDLLERTAAEKKCVLAPTPSTTPAPTPVSAPAAPRR